MSRYEQVISGRWYRLDKYMDLACCDCGLTHEVTIRVHRGVPQIRFVLNNRATAAIRRHDKTLLCKPKRKPR